MSTAGLLVAQTAHRWYALPKQDVFGIRTVDPNSVENGMVKADLGALFDPNDRSALPRRHGLFVPLRRKQVVLMVDRVDLLEQQADNRELPGLVRARLSQPWATGVLLLGDRVVIQIDLRAVARSVLLARST